MSASVQEQTLRPVRPVSVAVDRGRRRRSIRATMVVIAMVAGPIVFVAMRWTTAGSEGPSFGLIDLTVLPLVVLSLLTVVRLMRQRRRPRRVRLLPRALQRGIGDEVELSLLGTGSLRRWTIAPPSTDLRALPMAVAASVDSRFEPDPATPVHPSRPPSRRPPSHRVQGSQQAAVPTPVAAANTAADAVDYHGQTRVHTVARGDTWWTLAAACLGDGRRWRTLVHLNRDREVASGTILTVDVALSRGWQILLPAPAEERTTS